MEFRRQVYSSWYLRQSWTILGALGGLTYCLSTLAIEEVSRMVP